jgi:hypothetical protein
MGLLYDALGRLRSDRFLPTSLPLESPRRPSTPPLATLVKSRLDWDLTELLRDYRCLPWC